jgi:hypothetical protein
MVYPPQQPSTTVYVEQPARPYIREYDQYGQEVRPSAGGGGGSASSGSAASAIYLLAFNDHSILAAAAYWVDGRTLHYVTLEHQEKQVPLEHVDRQLSAQLNRERNVAFHLPQ